MISTIFALLAAAPAAAPVASPPEDLTTLTTQALFDQASAHAEAGECITAVREFETLEGRNGFKTGTVYAGMIGLRKGVCLIRMARVAEGEIAIQQGMPAISKPGAGFNGDMGSGLTALGDAALARWDYAAAKHFYEEAQAIPGGTTAATIEIKLAQATAFDGGDTPLRYVDAAILSLSSTPDYSVSLLAEFKTLRGRILLNQGRNVEAYEQLKEVLKLTGKLDLTVSLADVAIRGDLALAAQMNGDKESARKYLAYTGAGHIEQSPFSRALNMEAPTCGSESGLRPEDFAVVDFAIHSSGRIIAARTVYSRGSAKVAAQFAEAVSKWTWDPDSIAKIPPFFLLAPRVEMRCTTQGQQAPSIMSPLISRFNGWATTQLGLSGMMEKVDLAALSDAIPATAKGNAATENQVAVLGLQALNGQVYSVNRYLALNKVIALASDTIPTEVTNALKIALMDFRVYWSDFVGKIASPVRSAGLNDMRALLEDAQIANDPLAADTVRLLGVESRYTKMNLGNAVMLANLSAVAKDSRLPQHHPLRQVANLRLANYASQQNDYAAAQSYFKATGLTEEQCAYLGVRPAMQKNGIKNSSFPREAINWGFDGWVQLEYDIDGNGVPVGARAVISYPPFIFSDAATKSATSLKYETSYRPNGGPACSANRQNINYRMAK